MTEFNYKLIILVAGLGLTSCKNSVDPILSKYPADSKQYKDQMAAKIQSEGTSVRYTLENYFEEQGLTYLTVHAKGSDFEGDAIVLVNDWSKLSGIKRTKGIGYSGAELKGLTVDALDMPTGARLIFKDVHEVVD